MKRTPGDRLISIVPLPPSDVRGEDLDYVPFIVLSNPRSGTSMLIQSLRRHPNAIAFGEVFNLNYIGFNTPGFDNKDRRLRRHRDRSPAEFLDVAIFRPYAADIHAVGFKVFYRDLARARFEGLATALGALPRLRVIRLCRRNALRAYLSGVIAAKTGVWGVSAPEQRRPLRVRLEVGDCEAHFEQLEAYGKAYRPFFEDHATLEVTFEELGANLDRGLHEVQEFLGLEPRALRPASIVQETRPLAEAIENYRELEVAFAHTRWARFLDE